MTFGQEINIRADEKKKTPAHGKKIKGGEGGSIKLKQGRLGRDGSQEGVWTFG